MCDAAQKTTNSAEPFDCSIVVSNAESMPGEAWMDGTSDLTDPIDDAVITLIVDAFAITADDFSEAESAEDPSERRIRNYINQH